MPKLSQFATMHRSKVYRWITKLPQSDYYGQNPKIVEDYLDKNEAFRYLAQLIVMNDQNQSNLLGISEADSSVE